MKNLIIVVSALILFSIQANAQVQFGTKFGIHSFDLNSPDDIVTSDNENIMFSDAKIGFQGGIYTKIQLGGIFLEPRLMLHSTSVEYTFNGDNGGIIDNVVSERFTNLDIPVLVGIDLALIDIYAGPVAHLHLNTSSDLFDWEGYEDRFDTAQYGFRVGLGGNLGKINVGLEYEGNFSKFGDHISIAGQEFSFDSRPSRLILNLGIRIF
jgi:hypothetical protein